MTNIFSKLSLATIGITLISLFALTQTAHAANTSLSTLQSGDLIRGETQTSVYYLGEDGMRYVFPNEDVYFSWYSDFSNVKWISNKDLATFQLGGNVTFKPGSVIVKIGSGAHMYAISKNGVLRKILSETVVKELYGEAWGEQVYVLPDSFSKDYTIEGVIEFASQYSPVSEQQNAESINTDKSLRSATIIKMTKDGYDLPTIHILPGHAVRWINTDSTNHSASEWDGIWGSGTLKPKETFTKYFTTKGRWMYYSKYDEKTKVGGAIIID